MHIVLVIVAKYGDTMCCEEERKEAILVTESMIQRGGEFVKALGKALEHADLYNTRKIKEAFPEYWDTYKVLAVRFSEEE